MDMQPGNVHATYADTQGLEAAVNYVPAVGVKEGVQQFVDWYRDFYGI